MHMQYKLEWLHHHPLMKAVFDTSVTLVCIVVKLVDIRFNCLQIQVQDTSLM